MYFLDELYMEKKMTGCSGGTAWLTNKSKKSLSVTSPVDGEQFALIPKATEQNYSLIVTQAEAAFSCWRSVPAAARTRVRFRRLAQGVRFEIDERTRNYDCSD